MFDTNKSSASSMHEARTVPYSGNIITADGPMPYAVPIFQGADASSARELDALGVLVQQLQQANEALAEDNDNLLGLESENQSLRQEMAELAALPRASSQSEELQKAQQENASLTEMLKIYEAQNSSFDPLVHDRVAELEHHNLDLRRQIQDVSATKQSESNLSGELSRVHEENSRLTAVARELEEQLVIAAQSSSAGPAANQAQRRDADLREREEMMSDEIDRLQTDIASLQQALAKAEKKLEASGGANAENKPKQFICC